MAESALKIGQFLVTTFGLPGALLAIICITTLWLWKAEREAHDKTRAKVDEINEKRIEAMGKVLETLGSFKTSLDAVISMGKSK